MLLLFIGIGLAFFLAWITSNFRKPKLRHAIAVLLVTSPIAFISFQSVNHTKTSSDNSSLKYILIWKHSSLYPISALESGQRAFIDNNCAITSCYVTYRRDFFEGDDSLTKFDAIIFFDIRYYHQFKVPKMRLPHQIYVFMDIESADNYPMCDPIYDNFFNWTVTYKLNSDVVFSYVRVVNNTGHEVGPRMDMTWIDQMSEVDEIFRNSLKMKSKAVAWFVSHCRTRGKREVYAEALKKELRKQNLVLDVYGSCNGKNCPRANQSHCYKMLGENYYFYLSFENSISEDYVTEKLNAALLNSVVPIVYGGANYSRFVPPGSYLDARKYTPSQLASVVAHFIRNHKEYSEFFRWRNYYSYINTETKASMLSNDMCNLCAALNDQNKRKHKVYKDFRRWWHPNYKTRCPVRRTTELSNQIKYFNYNNIRDLKLKDNKAKFHT